MSRPWIDSLKRATPAGFAPMQNAVPTGVASPRASSTFFFSSRRRHTSLQGDWSSDVCSSDLRLRHADRHRPALRGPAVGVPPQELLLRSEERRVGKECRARGAPDHEKKKQTTEVSVKDLYVNVLSRDLLSRRAFVG